MLLEWFVLLCLLSVPIHVAATHNETHAVFTRAADESLDALSQDLLHFVTLSVQLNVRDKMKQGPLDVQSLADRISDLGVSFWKLDQEKVADLEAQLTAIGSGVDTECSAGCALPTEVTAGFGVIDTLKGKEAEIQTAFAVSYSAGTGQIGKVAEIENGLTAIEDITTTTAFKTSKTVLNGDVKSFKVPSTGPAVEKSRNNILNKIFGPLEVMKSKYYDLTQANIAVSAIKQTDMTTEADIVKKFKGLPDISKDILVAQKSVLDAFKQNAATFSANIEKIKTLIEQNKPLVLAELKTLEKLNVGSKFLNYFDNSFTASKWLTKLLAGKEDKNLDALKDTLKDVKSIGERLDPLRTSVENVNSLKAHETLLAISSLLEQMSSLLLGLSQSTSELSNCVKNLNVIDFPSMDIDAAINNLDNPENHVKEFKDSLGQYMTDHEADWNHLIKQLDDYAKDKPAMINYLKDDVNINKLKDTMDKIKSGMSSIKKDAVKTWLEDIKITAITSDSIDWITNSAILTTLDCLKNKDSIASVNAQVGGVQDVGKLGKSDANAANAIKVATELKSAIDQWKQLAAPPTRRRRAPAESTAIDELIVSTMAVRRLIRACSKGTLATLLQGFPQLDATVKATFEQVISSCEVLKEKAASATKVSDLSHVLLALNPLGDTFIDTVKLADELTPTTSDAALQQALQDLKQIDLNFARHDSPKVGQALDSLEVDFANLLGSSGKEPETIELNGCVGGDCEEPSSSVGLVIGIVAVVVVVLVLGGGAIYYFSVYRPKQQAKKGNDDEKGGDEDKKKKDGKNDRKKGKKSGTDSKTNSKGEEKSEEPKQAPEGGNAPPPEQQPPGENPEQPVAKIAKSVEVEKKVEVKKEAQKTKKKTSKVDPKAYEEAKERKKTEQELINDKFRANIVEMGPNKIPTSFTYENLLQGMERAREYDAKMARLENQVECSPAKYLSGDQVPTIYRYLVGPEDEILVNTDKDLSSQRVEKTQRSARTTTTTTSQERSSAGVEGPSTSSTRSLAEFEKYLLEIEASLDDLGVPHFKDMVPDKVPDKSLPTVWIGGDGWTDEQIAELESFATVHKGDN